jgi:uracil-DNA glycosylase
MISEKIISILQRQVFELDSTGTMFNLYKDVDLQFDKVNAATIRQENLKSYVRSCFQKENNGTVLIVGEAPGPWGCRFSGIPFTSEAQLLSSSFPIKGQQSSKSPIPYKSRTSKIFWEIMEQYYQDKPFFVWNCIPFHPHENEKDKPLSIRNPSTKELREHSRILTDLIQIIDPEKIVAVGKKSEKALSIIGTKKPTIIVRHPSRGGATEFKAQIKEVFNSR